MFLKPLVWSFVASSSSRKLPAMATARQSTRLFSSKPLAVIVQAEIQADRMDEFLTMIENNAIQSRKEPGCLRFDVLRCQDETTSNSNKFVFYEVYESAAAIDHHKEQSHYQSWADFKESGGVISSVSTKADGTFMTG